MYNHTFNIKNAFTFEIYYYDIKISLKIFTLVTSTEIFRSI